MTIEQRKRSLISWITNLNDETVLNQIENYRQASLNDFPNEIVDLLKVSAAEPLEDCIEHTSVQDILNRKD
ncbi:MAG: hypothetical protein JXR10_14105 [Cyclobacteriaceae bacterium]